MSEWEVKFVIGVARFRDRKVAGQLLAKELSKYANCQDLVILALPRGGVPVGFEVAKALNAPLEIFVVRKLGVPGDEELAMGAIAAGGIRLLDEEVIRLMRISDQEIEAVSAREQEELRRRELAYRGQALPLRVTGMTSILVDDGIATGSTMKAAVTALRQQCPSKLIVAVPTAPPSTCDELRRVADEVVALITPKFFFSVARWYTFFGQTSDEEVRQLYQRSRRFDRERSGGVTTQPV
jgi:putative phosphoribosyl transferase